MRCRLKDQTREYQVPSASSVKFENASKLVSSRDYNGGQTGQLMTVPPLDPRQPHPLCCGNGVKYFRPSLVGQKVDGRYSDWS